MTKMTERQYDLTHNEGGEGFNPIREARLAAEAEAARNAPITLDDLYRRLERFDNSLARETGTFDQARVDAIKAQIAEMKAAEEADFLAIWTSEITAARRTEWNTWVRANQTPKGLPTKLTFRKEEEQGWSMNDLRRAVALHKEG